MISRELYQEKLGEAILLTNTNLKRTAQDLIYDRIARNYTNEDFTKAINDVTESDTLKLSYPLLVKKLNYYRMLRAEHEAKDEAARAEEESRQFWNMDRTLSDDCLVHKCYSCERRQCDTMAKACVEGIKAMTLGDIKLPELMAKLAKEFPGAGFANDAPRRGPAPTKKAVLTVVDNDFIPELELPNAIQDTLGLDGRTTDHV